MRRLGILLGAAVSLAALTVSVADLGVGHTLIVLAVLTGIALATGAGVAWVLRARRRGVAGPIATQLALVIASVIAPLLLALLILSLAMFVSGRDAVLVGVIVALSGVLGIVAAGWLTRGIAADVTGIADCLLSVGEGARSVAIRATTAAELRQLATQAEAMVASLTREETARAGSEETRRLLLAHASHDLRTPVTAMRLLAAALVDDIVEGELRREYVAGMLTHIEALSALIDDLFELSRLQAGAISWSLQRVCLSDLVDETVAAMAPQAQARGVAVRADLPDALGPVQANPEKLQRVLFNLIDNAIHHSPADGTVTVRAHAGVDRVELEVEDAGPGIPAEDRPRVFDPFFRGGDPARGGDGAGLGLAIAEAIVDAHGGRIWLEDTSAGTRVRFSVPAAA
jgi:signal transduction histidine kinase